MSSVASRGRPSGRWASGFVVAVLALLGLLFQATAHAQAIVAAASDLKFAVEDVAARFAADTGRSVRLVFGSSGHFARQVQEGAPFHLFMSADEDLVFRLADAGRAEDRGVLYAVGRLALFAPNGSTLNPDAGLRDLAAALKDGRLKRFAIANPEHAPYGMRAQEVLRHLGLWEAIAPRLALGENVSQAAQFALSGDAQGGLIAYSLVLAPQLAGRGRFVLVPQEWHQPLRQRMVLLKGADDSARAFYAYLQQPSARAVLSKYGFAVPQ